MSNTPNRTSAAEVARFRELYDGGMSSGRIAEVCGRSRETVWRRLKSTGTVRSRREAFAAHPLPNERVRNFNEGYFEQPLTDDGAWLLGLIYGDGSVGKAGRFCLACGPDLDIATKVANILSYAGPSTKHIVNTRNCWMLELGSKRFVRSLALLGVRPAKTYTISMPELPEVLLSHFVRGLWDSDGSLSMPGRRLRSSKFLSARYSSTSRAMVEAVVTAITANTGLPTKVTTSARNRALPDSFSRSEEAWARPQFSVIYTHRRARIVSDLLYTNSTNANRCDRKFNIFLGSR